MRRGEVGAIAAAVSIGLTGCTADDRSPGPSEAAAVTDVVDAPEHYETTMRSHALSLGIDDPPAVRPVRVVRPDEVEQLIATCLTELGFPATADPNGGVGYESAPGQELAGAVAEYTCLGRYPLADQYVQPLSREQRVVYYDWQVDEVLPCLTALGYPAPEIPSRDVYLSGDVIWFLEPPGLEGAELAEAMAELMRECEPMPPTELVYGPGEGQAP